MKTYSVSFAALLLPALAFADSVEVTFNAALTNNTGWVYDTIKVNNKGYHIDNKGAYITSPVFDFCITSATIHVDTSDSCTRNLIISPLHEGALVKSLSRETSDIPKGSESDVTAYWNIADNVNALKIESTSGSQKLYLKFATISGVRHVDVPTGLSVTNVSGSRFTLTWTNPDSATANAVHTSRILEHPAQGNTEAEYSFAQFSNPDGNSKEITETFTNTIPSFSDSSLIYLPPNSSGMIQISRDDAKGYLVHSGFNCCSNISIVMATRIPTDDHGKEFGIGYESSTGSTNEFATFNVSVDFATNLVSMAGVPDGAPIIFNTQGSNSKRVVHVDYLSFVRNYMPAYVETNETARLTTTSSYATVKGLKPNSHYVVYVTAFDGDGNESAPSEPIEVWTSDKNLPFTISIK